MKKLTDMEATKKMKWLDAYNWQGIDASLETSLMDYYLICTQDAKDCKENDEYFVLFFDGQHFDCGYKREKELDDLINGDDWMNEDDIKSFLRTQGMNRNEWTCEPFVCKLYDLINYFGIENLMGSIYYPLDEDEIKNFIESK